MKETKEAMLNVVKKLNELLNNENRDNEQTKQEVSISTALTGAGKTYISAMALEQRIREYDKSIQSESGK